MINGILICFLKIDQKRVNIKMCEKQDSFMIVFRVKRFIEHYLLVNAVSCIFTTTVHVVFISFVKTQTSV